jgi:hypothetical protein
MLAGVYAARTLLTGDDRFAAISVLNVSGKKFVMTEDTLIGIAVPGVIDSVTHRIDTADSKPIAEPLRRHPRAYLDLIDETVDKLLKANVIEEAASTWSANLVWFLNLVILFPG